MCLDKFQESFLIQSNLETTTSTGGLSDSSCEKCKAFSEVKDQLKRLTLEKVNSTNHLLSFLNKLWG